MNYKTLQFEQSPYLYNYQLSHLYQTDGSVKNFTTFIAPEIIKPLIAYIEQFTEKHIDESWSIGFNTITETINQYYAPVYQYHPKFTDFTNSLIEIDQHINLITFSGTGIHQNINFQRDFKHFLIKQIEKEKLNSQQKIGEDAFNTLDPNYTTKLAKTSE